MPDSWRQIDEIFQAALEREPAGRAAFLDEACAGDAVVRAKVEALIASDEQAQSFIESPALEMVARLEAGNQPQELEGRMIGPYKVISRLGAGGMGEVYLAKDNRLGRNVALKLLPFELTKDEHKVLRFKQEARTASALNHPNIITIYDIGESDSLHFIATEFVNGKTLRHNIVNTSMTWQETLDIVIQAASALAAAHKAGVVHRDIKPENIMIRSDGYVKVLDFGIAKLTERESTANDPETAIAPLVNTEPGLLIGTPRYMSPEQVRGEDVDGRSDIFSLGAMLYEMVAGSHPFKGRTTSDIIAAILEKEPPPIARYAPGLPIQLQVILTRALKKDRSARYRVIEEMIEDLKWLKQQPENKEHQRATFPVSGEADSRTTHVMINPQAVFETPHYVAGLSGEIQNRPTLTGGNPLTRVTNYSKGAALALAILLIAAMMTFLLYQFVIKKDTTDLTGQGNSQSTNRVTLVTPQKIDNPSPVELGVTNEVALDSDERAYFETSLPAGEYKVILDIHRDIGRDTNLRGGLSILDQEGGVLEPDVISFNEIDVDYRRVHQLVIRKPVTIGFKLYSHLDKTVFWFTLLKASTPNLLSPFGKSASSLIPFFGKISPTPIQEAEAISGEFDAFESAYYILPLKKGDYKVILDFTNSDGRNTNIQGYLALLDEDGGNQQNIIKLNEIDVSYRKLAPFSVKKDSNVIIRLKNEINNVKYGMKILPASQ